MNRPPFRGQHLAVDVTTNDGKLIHTTGVVLNVSHDFALVQIDGADPLDYAATSLVNWRFKAAAITNTKHREMNKPELLEELDRQVNYLQLEYVDTYRATPETNGIEEHVRKQSCCGVFEHKYTCASGRTYFLGCNYGH